MSKLSKLIVMAVVILAVVTMSVSVKAFTNSDLIGYVNNIHNINNIIFELKDNQKTAIINYLTAHPVSDEVANSIKADIDAAEKQIANTGATNVDQISKDVKANVIALVKSAASKAGLTLTVNSADETFVIKTSDGKVLTSGSARADVSYATGTGANAGTPASSSASKTSTATTKSTGKKLLYTGSNYALYVLPVVAIVAVAVLGRKKIND